ncbi:MAG: hypothetical protein JO233_09635 [Candidatus Eremiobacteraeota bacterium]|nr:hypothetical protein [Candidatus Eremiobacteraeota bacterium]
MTFFLRVTAALSACAFLGLIAPAGAASGKYVPPKLKHLGTSSIPNAGSGVVLIKVLVKPDSSFQVQNVFKSTNKGNNATALDIARHSTYSPATRGGQPVVAFYDFTLKFNGKSVSSGGGESSGGGSSGGGSSASGNFSPEAVTINHMLHAGNYAGAKTAATAYLQTHPDDQGVQLFLGLADALTNQDVQAAAAFDKAGTIPATFAGTVSQSYAVAAVQSAHDDAMTALSYAQKAMALKKNGNSYFAMGVADLANNNTADAITNLKLAHDEAGNVDKQAKINIDSQLLTAYLAANDQTNASAISAEIQQLDPTSTAGARAMANYHANLAQAAESSNKFDVAAGEFENAGAAAKDSTDIVTAYARATFDLRRMDKPDVAREKADADKAIAADPNNPLGNFAEGLALIDQSATDASKKAQGITFLQKADAQAKAANNLTLATQIENILKQVQK